MSTAQTYANFPFDEASWLNDMLLTWSFPLARYYRKHPPSFQNTIKLPDRLKYNETRKLIATHWKEEKLSESPSIFKAIWNSIKSEYITTIILGISGQSLTIITVMFMGYIIDYMNESNPSTSNIIGYIIGYGISVQANSLLTNMSMVRSLVVISKLKGILTEMILKKSLKTHLSEISQGDQSSKLTTIISSDIEFLDGLSYFIFFFNIPFLLIGSAILLGFRLGVAGIIGLLVAIFHLPFIMCFGKIIGKYRLKTASISDSRMKMITNLIEGIRIVKLYGWEHPYLDGLFAKRAEEIKQFKSKGITQSLSKAISSGSVGLVLFVTFSVYVALGNTIEASSAFSSIAILIVSSNMINNIGTMGIMQIFLLMACSKRITGSLLLKEKSKTDVKSELKKFSIQARKSEFAWGEIELPKSDESELTKISNEKKWSLHSLKFNCKPSELIIVIGAVGSGKSALFMGLLKEIPLINGSLKISGSLSFASEEPWIISGTIKENILMGRSIDNDWYDKVTKACSLQKDFELFKEHRDETVVGDRGITLSGGQKARVSLARAVYANNDIILLDDPLSAVDPEVCASLFNDCIKGLLKEKTVILATHQAHFVSQADKILILDNGQQIFFGDYEELIRNDLTSYLGKIAQTEHKKEEKIEEKVEIEEKKTKRIEGVKDKKSIVDEESAQGSVPFSTYWKFLMLGFKSTFFLLLVILLQIITQISNLSITYWVVYWSRDGDQENTKFYYGMAILVAIYYVLAYIRSLSFTIPLVNSSEKLHNVAISGLSYTQSLFFDKNPTGRMLNRFSKDVSQTDEILLFYIGEVFVVFTLVIGNFIVIGIINPFMFIVLFVMLVYFYFITKFFTAVNKNLKRLELLTKSPILSILNSTIHGLSTIRCLNLQTLVKSEMNAAVQLNIKTFLTYQVIYRAIQMYLEIGPNVLSIVNIIVLVSIKDSMQPGLAGMSIALSITIMGYLGYSFRLLIETDNYMACPQRLLEYQSLPSEGNFTKSSGFEITNGRIEVKNLYMRYRENYDYALKGLNFIVQAKSRTGIIGRTGAGKSSIMQVLFRLTNPETGTIVIDGQDYLLPGLHELRKQMSVIPQSATLFIASLRDNLDPFHQHSDQDIVSVLKKVRLGTLLEQLPEGLNSQINSKGLSLSAGQKQLVCLARAILRKNKIVMIDEATANVDSETDEFIQKQLLRRFKHSTLLVIAHRLRTIIRSDWIVVMDQGMCKEEGTPRELVMKKDSAFLEMINHTGPQESQFLLSQLEM